MADNEKNAVEAKLKEAKKAIKTIRDKEEMKKFADGELEKRNANRAMQSAMDNDALAKKQFTKIGERGERVSRASKVRSNAKTSIRAEIAAYNDLRNAVMGIMKDNYDLCKFLHYSSKKVYAPAVQEAINWVKTKVDEFIIKDLDEGTWKADHPKVQLPNLQYEANFEDERFVNFTVKREDGGVLETSVAKDFNDMIKVWFDTKTTNAPLTKELIEAHKQEFSADFNAIMENDLAVSLTLTEKEVVFNKLCHL